MKLIKSLFITMLCFGFIASFVQCKQGETMKVNEPYSKKYTNADFYVDGKLDPEIALKAYLDMFEYYEVPYSDFVKENLWITDFNLGDFENVGMGGIFWVNDPEGKYLGHEIYLLPGQMIVEHKHVATEFPAKMESWQMRHGWAYNFSIGSPTPNPPKLPESQKDHITASHFHKQVLDEVLHLVELESPHFLFAGPEGAIITEFANYHDGDGLRFTNPYVEFIDVLSE